MVRYLLLLLLLNFADSLRSQELTQYDVAGIPTALRNRANAVNRNMSTTLDIREAENVILTVKEATTILNKGGEKNAALFLNYDKNTTIKRVKGTILNGFGKLLTTFSLNEFQDQSAADGFSLFVDDRLKYYIPSVTSYPYTIIYEYEIKYKQNLILPDWHANPNPGVAVEKSVFTLLAKPQDKIHVKAYNYKGLPEIVSSEKLYRSTWTVADLSAVRNEPYSPDEQTYLTSVKISPERFRYYGHSGSYSNWQDLGKWVYSDLIKDRQALSPDVVEEIKNLVKDSSSDKEKVRKIYSYVQQKTRYVSVQVGLGGYQPFSAMDVHRLSYGDCKALVNYTQSLLKAAGIHSDYCVVSAGTIKQNPDPEFASMNQFNHVILCVPLKNDTTWLECTSQDIPFGYLGSFTDDRLVWACTEGGGKLIKTPALGTKDNLSLRRAEVKLDADGNIQGKMQTTYQGSKYDDFEKTANEPYAVQLKVLQDSYEVDNIVFNEVKLEQHKDAAPVLTENLTFSVPGYVPSAGNRSYLIPNLFNRAASISELTNRILPVYLNRGYTEDDEVTYTLPENRTVETQPNDKATRSIFGTFEVTTKLKGNKLVYHRKLVINSGTYSAGSYTELTAFLNEVSNSDNSKIVLKIR